MRGGGKAGRSRRLQGAVYYAEYTGLNTKGWLSLLARSGKALCCLLHGTAEAHTPSVQRALRRQNQQERREEKLLARGSGAQHLAVRLLPKICSKNERVATGVGFIRVSGMCRLRSRPR
jgi:hypothetical protein